MALIIETKITKQHGLETYQIFVNGTLLNTFMSKAAAETKVAHYIRAWNVEKIGQVRAQRVPSLKHQTKVA